MHIRQLSLAYSASRFARTLRNRVRGEGWKVGRDKNLLNKFSWVRPLSQQMIMDPAVFV